MSERVADFGVDWGFATGRTYLSVAGMIVAVEGEFCPDWEIRGWIEKHDPYAKMLRHRHEGWTGEAIKKVAAAAQAQQRFIRLDALEKAARAVCQWCDNGTEIVGYPKERRPERFTGPSQTGEIWVVHPRREGDPVHTCDARRIRRLQLEEWRGVTA